MGPRCYAVTVKHTSRHRLVLLWPFLCGLLASPLITHSASDKSELSQAYADYKKAVEAQDYETALVYARKSDQIAQRELEADNLQRGILAYNLGVLYYRLDRYQDSLAPLERASQTYQAHYGPQAIEILPAVQKLSATHEALRNWPQAEKSHLQSIRIIEAHQGRQAEAIATVLAQLMKVAEQQKEFKREQNYGRRALFILNQAGKTRSLNSGRLHVDLVSAEMQLGDANKANQHMEWAIEIFEENLDPQDPQLGKIYKLATQVFQQTGREPSARKYRRMARDFSESKNSE